MATILVTGGAGFIGSCYVLAQCAAGDTVINLDKLTYSGNPRKRGLTVRQSSAYFRGMGDIGNAKLMEHLLKAYRPNAVVNFAGRKPWWNVRFLIQKPSCAPTSSEYARFCAPPKPGGANWTPAKKPPFASCMSPRTRCSGHFSPAIRPSRKQRHIP